MLAVRREKRVKIGKSRDSVFQRYKSGRLNGGTANGLFVLTQERRPGDLAVAFTPGQGKPNLNVCLNWQAHREGVK